MYKEWALLNISKNKKGFTIVELLIVVVVIAILAAITVIAYNGIQNRAKLAAAQSLSAQAGKKLATYAVTNAETYPLSTDFLNVTGLSNSSSAEYDYIVSTDQKKYCVSVTNPSVDGASYAMTNNSGGTVAGRCVTNLLTNPSIEGNTASFATSSFAGMSRTVGSGPAGNAYLALYRSTTGDAYAGMTSVGVPPANSPYTLSFWVWADTNVTLNGSIALRAENGGVCCTNLAALGTTNVTTTPTRIVLSGLTGSNPTRALQTIIRATATTGQNIYYDGFMLTTGTNVYSFNDGRSSGWSWTGSEDASTSFGPAVAP